MRVQTNPADIGRCGCGRRDYCDGSHGLSESQWQALRAKEAAAAGEAGQAIETGREQIKSRAAPAGSAPR